MRPRLKSGRRLHRDSVRGRWVLLAPERIVELDEIAAEIVEDLDGLTAIDEIVADLAAAYEAPEPDIRADVEALIADLRAKGHVA